MKRATILAKKVCDGLALIYESKGQLDTIMEIIVQTRGEAGELVNLHEIGATRSVLISRWLKNAKVVHITATAWLRLRGTARATKDQSSPRREEEESSSDRKV